MIKLENTEVVGWEAAIRGMRNPLESWEKSDSFGCDTCKNNIPGYDITMHEECGGCCSWNNKYKSNGTLKLGSNDLNLMMNLRNAGTDHRKFMRMIVVYCDITAPLYWWKEFDTYKVGTVANSCSTMHKIADKEFTLEDFSFEHLLDGLDAHEDGPLYCQFMPLDVLSDVIIPILNKSREKYLETKDKKYWWQMIQLLPSSYNQKRTIMMNYEVLANIYRSRKNHKLDEWVEFCKWIESLPYSEIITGEEGMKNG